MLDKAQFVERMTNNFNDTLQSFKEGKLEAGESIHQALSYLNRYLDQSHA